MMKSLLAFGLVFLFTGCYDDQALLNDPTINPIENAEDKIAPVETHRRYYRRYYRPYYRTYYYYY